MATSISDSTGIGLNPKGHPWFEGSPSLPGEVPTDLAHRVPGVGFTLFEWTNYHLTIPGAISLKVGNVMLSPIGSSHTFVVNITNRLGTTDITPIFKEGIGEPVIFEVLATKFRNLRQSLNFSQSMVHQLSAKIRAMPFVVRAETSRHVVHEHGVPNLFFTFHFLRHNGEELIRALSIISADPHRKQVDVVESLRVHQAKHIDAEALYSLLTGPRAGEPNHSPDARPIDLLQPLRITQRRPEETYNTPENRFVVTVCRRFLHLMDAIQLRHWWVDATEYDRVIFRDLARAIRILLQSDRFRTLDVSLRVPAYSRVLQMKPGYRELTSFWNGLTQVHVPVLQRLSDAVDLRDVPTLYEYWQFFELAEAIANHIGVRPVMELQHDVYPQDWGLKADFPAQGRLHTQMSFHGSNTYTPITLRPDFVWQTVDGRKIIMDAKFAMTSIGDLENDDESLPASRASTRDITKMHAYRDAIDGVQAALVLYPGTQGAFWNTYGGTQDFGGLEEIIEAIVDCDLDGIGAVPFSPEMEG